MPWYVDIIVEFLSSGLAIFWDFPVSTTSTICSLWQMFFLPEVRMRQKCEMVVEWICWLWNMRRRNETKYEWRIWWWNAFVDYWLQSCIPSRQANSFKPQPTLENEIAEAAKIRNYEITQMRTVFFSFWHSELSKLIPRNSLLYVWYLKAKFLFKVSVNDHPIMRSVPRITSNIRIHQISWHDFNLIVQGSHLFRKKDHKPKQSWTTTWIKRQLTLLT